MKKNLPFFLFVLLFSISPTFSQTCANTTLQPTVVCTRSSNYAGEILPNAGCGVFNILSPYSPGTYFRMPVLAGGCYTISTCGSSIDTQLGAYQGLAQTTGPYAYDDDNGPDCSGTQASIVIVPSFSDYTTIDVRQYNCLPGGSASITVKVRQNNNLTITSSSVDMCQGQTRSLTATPAAVGSAQSGSGSLGVFSGTGVSGTTFTAPVPAGANATYVVTYAFGYCTATQNIIVYRTPSTSNAGVNFSAACGSTTATLNATVPTYGAGAWAVQSGAGSVTSPTSYNSGVTGLVPGTSSTFRWTVSNGPCATSFSDVTITVPAIPTISSSVSPSDIVCGGSLVTLNGIGGTSYTWTGGVTDAVPFVAASTQTYTVTGTSVDGCTNTATQTITVLPSPVVSSVATPNDSICIGNTVTLYGVGAVSYAWSGGVVDSATFGPASTQIYTVTGTAANGCTATATQMVVVGSPPVIGSTVSPSATVCEGTNVILSGTGGAGYTWTGGVTDGVAFPATSTTTYTVTGTQNGCSNTSTRTITVNPAPVLGVLINPADTICVGASVILSGTGAVSYSWSGGVTDSVAFIPPASQIYTVTGTGANGCTNTATQAVTLNPLPPVGTIASPLGPVCTGSSVILNGTNATSYTWTGGVTNNVSFAAGTTQTYTVTGTDDNGCTNTSTLTVNVNPLPTVVFNFSTDSVCDSYGMITLSGNSPAGGSFTGNHVLGSSFNPQGVPLGNYVITYTYTDGNNCTNSATDNILVSGCLSIEDLDNSDLVLYPNPSTGKFYLSIKNSATGNINIFVVDMQGKMVYRSEQNKATDDFIKEIDISEEAPGIYFLHVLFDGGKEISKRIVKH
jgi:hypothetical protein